MLRTADERFERIADQTARQLQILVTPVAITVDLLAWQRLTFATSLAERLGSLGYLREALAQSEHLSALFVSYDDGDFFLLRRLLADSPLRAAHAAPDQARYLAQSVERDEGGAITATFLFFDADLNLLRRDSRPEYTFDPRTRPWYQIARTRTDRIRTDPYLFFTTREVGITLARRATTGMAVVGADLTLRALSTALAASRFLPSTQLALFDNRGQVIAHPDAARLPREGDTGEARLARLAELNEPVLAQLDQDWRDLERRAARLDPTGFTLEIADQNWRGMVKTLPFQGGVPLLLALAVPECELLADAVRIRNRAVLITIGLVLLALPVTWLLARRIARHLYHLVSEAARIRR